MDLNCVRAFVKVVETSSFRGAARALGVPKTTVSRRVRELEEQLGIRLLQRTTRRMALTDAGQALFGRCAPALVSIDEAGRSVAELREVPRGLLRVSMPTTFGQLFIVELASEFLVRYPEVRLAIELSDRHVDLVSEGYDVAIRGGELPDSSLRRRELGTTRMQCLASPEYLKVHPAPQTPRELTQHACVLYGSMDPGTGTGWTFETPSGPLKVQVRGRLAANSYFTVRDSALRGLGIARMFSFLAAEAVREGQLVPVLEAYGGAPMRLAAVYPSSQHLSAKLKALLDFLVERLTPPPWEPEARRPTRATPRRARPASE